MKRIAIFGATSRIAKGCARIWIGQGARLVLVARDAARLASLARDLEALPGATGNVRTLVCDALDRARLPSLPGEAAAVFDGIDGVLIAHGTLFDQRRCQGDLALAQRTIDVNGTSAALVAEAFAGYFERRGSGFIAVIGSVAGDRGRRSNYVYGAAKGLVERYTEGLRHRLHRRGVNVTLVKPGPTATPMTAGLAVRGGKMADPDKVARDVVDAIEAGRPVVYTPWKWRWIMRALRAFPEWVFVRMDL
jgi:decaprenylphospho-beta-D-erythro-pentofuranosid-2-ulose 2-reductase